MVSYDEALERILAATPDPQVEEMPFAFRSQLGTLLLRDVIAPMDLPPFANSAVDGFAVRRSDTQSASTNHPVRLIIVEEIAAGSYSQRELQSGEAARIFTGAPLPPGADALVMVEDTESDRETVTLFVPGDARFIRKIGSDIPRGAVAIPAGSRLGPGEIGLLSALNIPRISYARPPHVAIITTGDEIVAPARMYDWYTDRQGATSLRSYPYQFEAVETLQPGQIYDANGPALESALSYAWYSFSLHVPDDPEELRQVLTHVSQTDVDVIIASGGVSVGDRDYVKQIVQDIGELDFWRIAIKPGKPLAFGKIGKALFFGLPGNPVSSLVTFELFVRPVLRKLEGHKKVRRPQVTAVLTTPLKHEPGRREFVRVTLEWKNHTYHATPTGAQGSHRLSSLLGADALLIAHEDHGDYAVGEVLPAMLLTG